MNPYTNSNRNFPPHKKSCPIEAAFFTSTFDLFHNRIIGNRSPFGISTGIVFYIWETGYFPEGYISHGSHFTQRAIDPYFFRFCHAFNSGSIKIVFIPPFTDSLSVLFDALQRFKSIEITVVNSSFDDAQHINSGTKAIKIEKLKYFSKEIAFTVYEPVMDDLLPLNCYSIQKTNLKISPSIDLEYRNELRITFASSTIT